MVATKTKPDAYPRMNKTAILTGEAQLRAEACAREDVNETRGNRYAPASFTTRPLGSLRPHTPIADVGSAHVVARRIGYDDLGSRAPAQDDGVLSEHPPERDGLVAIHPMNEPCRLAPSPLRILLVSNACLYPVHAQDDEVAHHLMALLVDLARQEHRSGIVRGQHGEGPL